MADYIYLLENRLSRAQREALHQVREAARAHGLTVFLVGGAVRDLTSGAPIRDLDFAVQGDARVLSETLQAHGTLLGTHDLMQALYFSFPGGVRLEVSSTLSVTFPKPGKPEVQPAPVLEDLRHRDFTANAMAISLNEGSYGLLMDPTNGVADVENRELRLLSNYGFLEDPSRMIRATRLMARLGWQLEERTQGRYDNAKAENYMSALDDWARRYEVEEIFREEDPLRVLRKLEGEGWLGVLTPALNPTKVNEAELDRMRDIVGQLNALEIYPDPSAAAFVLLTAKLGESDAARLKREFALPGFAAQIDALESKGKALAAEFTGKGAASASASWKLLMAAEPEAVLWMAFNSKSQTVQAKFKQFLTEWPQARQRLPYQQMQEMRITPDIPEYDALLESLFFAVMDKALDTPEAIKAFLEPFSPPAAPPPPTLRRRAVKRESKGSKSRAKKVPEAEEVRESAVPSSVAEGSEEPSAEQPGESAPTSAEPAQPVAAVVDRAAPTTPAKHAEKAPAPQKVALKTVGKQAPVQGSAPPSARTKAAPVKAAAKAGTESSKAKAVAKKGTSAGAKKGVPSKAVTAAHGKAPAKGNAAVKNTKGAVAKSAAKTPPVKGKKAVPAKAKTTPAKAQAKTAKNLPKSKPVAKGKPGKAAHKAPSRRPAPKTVSKAAKGKRR